MHVAYPSIEHFRHVAEFHRRRGDGPITYQGTIKLHGTNAAIRFNPDGTVTAQSRTRDLSLESDNYGFCAFVHSLPEIVLWEMSQLVSGDGVVFGEWVGRGIQVTANLALDKIERCFVMFGHHSTPTLRDARVHSVLDMITYVRTVNYADPREVAVAAEAFRELTAVVDRSCPAGQYFGVEGVGEGIVWSPIGVDGPKFKEKGKSHTTSKVSQTNVDAFKAKADLNERCAAVVTEARIEQALHTLKDGDESRVVVRADIPTLIRWVVADVLKEELDMFEGVTEAARNRAIGNLAANMLRERIPA